MCLCHAYVCANAGCVCACVHECVRCMCTLCMYFNMYDINLCSNACEITIIAKCFRLKELWYKYKKKLQKRKVQIHSSYISTLPRVHNSGTHLTGACILANHTVVCFEVLWTWCFESLLWPGLVLGVKQLLEILFLLPATADFCFPGSAKQTSPRSCRISNIALRGGESCTSARWPA